mmetsp:Transcript_39218/g.34905  ORF Transcript_39218/g.34905 Transcript_39218/m.34905 type:complete len:132 (-) Transcript_39218:149-544(-)
MAIRGILYKLILNRHPFNMDNNLSIALGLDPNNSLGLARINLSKVNLRMALLHKVSNKDHLPTSSKDLPEISNKGHQDFSKDPLLISNRALPGISNKGPLHKAFSNKIHSISPTIRIHFRSNLEETEIELF